MRSIDDACVYAVGECAQHRGKLYGVPAVLDEQCKVLADHITATNPQASFLGSKEMTQLCVVGIELTSMGEPNVDRLRDEVLLHSEPYTDKYQRLVIRNGRLVSAILLGKCGKLEELSEAFQCGSVLPHQRLSLLADAG
jgi:nitrite reductase (NADH) large subunit